MARISLRPLHPERVCWGCDKYCPADDLACGNGTVRTMHPIELFGNDWLEWAEERNAPAATTGSAAKVAAEFADAQRPDETTGSHAGAAAPSCDQPYFP